MNRLWLFVFPSLAPFGALAQSTTPVEVPEPGTLGLLVTAVVAIYLVHRFKKSHKRH